MTIKVVLTVLVSVILAFMVALLMVNAAQAVPNQANVPVFTYGS
ncbi:hypothetical protein [Amycolatopsis sp. H20-H5]|nr:hypothetical protein [Amycolatopsis sp. H20-H5]MEC3980078.1 hypothetical protein [Amycolatopsis sp. H20-H5]